MNRPFGGIIDQCCDVLKLDFSSAELAQLAMERGFTQDTLSAFSDLFPICGTKRSRRPSRPSCA